MGDMEAMLDMWRIEAERRKPRFGEAIRYDRVVNPSCVSPVYKTMEEGSDDPNRRKLKVKDKDGEVLHENPLKDQSGRVFRMVISGDFMGSARAAGMRLHQFFDGTNIDASNPSLKEVVYLPYVITKLEFDRVPKMNRAPVWFESYDLNHCQYRRMDLIGVISGAPIAMKGAGEVTLAARSMASTHGSNFEVDPIWEYHSSDEEDAKFDLEQYLDIRTWSRLKARRYHFPLDYILWSIVWFILKISQR